MIEVSNLTKDYGFGRGVFDVSIHVERGEVFGFLDPNSAGKSTTIRHLMGFSKPDLRSTRILGEETFESYDKVLSRVGYIPEEIALPAGLTGWDFIRMLQSMQGIRNEERLNAMLKLLELEDNVLSTSTKRITVVFTQAVYLIGSLLAMFALTTVTGCICLTVVTEEVALTYGRLILLNLGAFLVLFALSGLCFFTSCVFDRSKRSMAIGGGLSIFALVAAMLGLFGSPVIPSVVRLKALNNFNYVTIISLFDVISIMDETGVFIGKFVILAVLGVVGYIAGFAIFTKKDLPL